MVSSIQRMRLDLPYLVTLHAPPPDGDQRNWHCHVLWSFRPMERIDDHEWVVGEMLRTDLDNPRAMKLMREMFAAMMTNASLETGHNQVWTAKSNADRGLPHEPQVHLGAAKTNRARSGEYVADNEENHERVLRSKAAIIDDRLRHLDEALAGDQEVQRSIARRWVRVPAVSIRVPQPAIAATLTAALPTPKRAVPLAPPIVIPSPAPVTSSAPVMVTCAIEPLACQPLPVIDIAAAAASIARHMPQPPNIVAHIDFANSRKPLAVAKPPAQAMPLSIAVPQPACVTPLSPLLASRRPAVASALSLRPLPVVVGAAPVGDFLRLAAIPERADIPASPRPLPGRPARTVRVSSLALLPPDVPLLQLDPIHAARRLLADRLRAADERRKREEAEAAAHAVAGRADVDAATIERRRRIDEACRILAQSPRRPYRIEGNRAFLDLDVMGRRERNAVEAVGLSDPEVADALLARIRRDRVEDERAQVNGLPSAPPLDELATLSRVAHEQEAATSRLVASGRLGSETPAVTRGKAANARRPDAASSAAIAAHLRDHQRGG